MKEVIKKVKLSDTPDKVNGGKPLIFGTAGHVDDIDAFKEMWFKEVLSTGFVPINPEEDMSRGYYPNRNRPMKTLPNPEFLKNVFHIQDEQWRDCEPHADNFELELKKFFAFGRRRTGRTRMLARVLVETAIESGRPIELVDHYIDKRGIREAVHHMRRQVMEVIHEYRHKEVYVEIVEETKDTIQLFLHPQYFNAYDRIKIENNPTKFIHNPFPTAELERRKKYLQLLLLC